MGEHPRVVDARIDPRSSCGSRFWPCSARAPGRAAQFARHRWAIAGAFAVTLVGQAVGALVDPDARNLLSISPDASVAHAVDRAQEFVGAAVTIVVLSLLVLRLQGLR